MKNFTKSIIGVSLVTIMAFTTSCGSPKKDAVSALDTVIANAQDTTKAVSITASAANGGGDMVLNKDASGNMYQSLSADGTKIEVYTVDGEVYLYANDIDASSFLDDAAKETYKSDIDAGIQEYITQLESNRASLDTATLVDVVEEESQFVINSTNEDGGTPVVITVAKDGSSYTFTADDGSTESITFSDEITVTLP